MKPKYSIWFGLLWHVALCWVTMAKKVAKEGETEVKLQFLEYELEDFCVSKNDAEWKFLNGSEPDLKKVLEVELKESEFYKRELEVLQRHIEKKFSHKKLQRLVDIFSHPGAPLLGNMEFKEYREYTIKLQELTGTMRIPCDENTKSNSESNSTTATKCDSIGIKKINQILYSEKNERKLKDWWNEWYRTLEEKNKKTKYDFLQQLSILDLEAEQNGEEELSEYWLKQADITWLNYETIDNLWKEILPLYEKLKRHLKAFVIKNYGEGVLRDGKIIPAHILGSLESYDWITAEEKLGGLDSSDAYQTIKNNLKKRKAKELYKIADNQTAELKLGSLPQRFYDKSRFNETSKTCENKITDYCEREHSFRAMFCINDTPNLKHYIQINENVMKIKYLILCGKEEMENGFLFREGPRESVLHEAMEGLSSLRALSPGFLEKEELLTNQTQQQKKLLSLFITALHVIPPLPYYLASDLWRINALREIDNTVGENADTTVSPTSSSDQVSEKKGESLTNGEEDSTRNSTSGEVVESQKTYDTQNLTRDWWSYREQYQGIGSPNGIPFDDYLQDKKIIWNKPYISKFLGRILQFQILEKTENLTSGLSGIQLMLQKGKSKPWEALVEETFNITAISVEPLLNYFKPLEEFLDKGVNLEDSTQTFSLDDFNFVSQVSPLNKETEAGLKPAEGSDALFFSLAAIAAVGVVAIIVSIGRRRYKKRQRARERKRRLEDL